MKISAAALMVFMLLCSSSYPMGQYPRTEKEDDVDRKATYTVIFYGGTYLDDPATVAFLDVEGDAYTIEPYESEYKSEIKKGLSAETALEESGKFISGHSDFYRPELKRISDENGIVIGYELRPLFHIQRFGRNDILDIRYRIKDKKVFVTVDLKRDMKRRLLDSDDNSD